MGSRFLHLVDSAVVLAAMSKGRSASNNLYNVVHRCNALLLASFCFMIVGHCRSDLNPADKPSRGKIRKESCTTTLGDGDPRDQLQ